jgi:ABC-type uncharacterized transport system permease subunit
MPFIRRRDPSVYGTDRSAAFHRNFSLLNAVTGAVVLRVITIPEIIKSGQMDLYITKPLNTLVHLSFENFDIIRRRLYGPA